jgi:hypothetical protein
MQIVNQLEYDGWKANNTDGYGAAIFKVAEQWANIIETKISQGKKISEIAQTSFGEADDEGLTGFMYNAAVAILAKCWIHGEELRKWHNLDCQIGNEGEKANQEGGVLNSAILKIG